MSPSRLSRRNFLIGGASGLTLIAVGCTSDNKAAPTTAGSGTGPASTAGSTTVPAATVPATTVPTATTIVPVTTTTIPMGTAAFNVGPSLTITDTGLVLVRTPRAEMGQGVLSAVALMVGDELDADVTSLRVVDNGMPLVPLTDGVPFTAGSRSIADSWEPFRQLGATARAMLLTAASTQLGVDVSALTIEKGVISGGGKSVTFGEIATAAGALAPPEGAVPKAADQRRLVGTDVARFDSLEKVTGAATFGSDVKVPGMLVATLLRGPKLQSKPAKWDESAALAVKGVSAVVMVPGDKLMAAGADDALAVVASSTWAAIKGRDALAATVTWTGGSDANTAALGAQLRALTATDGAVAEDGDAKAIMAGAIQVDQTYDVGYAAHLLMEPLGATAIADANRAEVWIGHQAEVIARGSIDRAVGLRDGAVTFHHCFVGTGFGRRFHGDFAAEAVFVAKAVGKPVRIQWLREDDIARGRHRPARATRVQASLNANGELNGINVTVAGDSIGRWDDPSFDMNGTDISLVAGLTVDQPYRLGVTRSTMHLVPTAIAAGIWRGVEHNASVFALESAISELARAGTIDEVTLRTTLLADNPRGVAVLAACVQASGWQAPTPTRAFGIAMSSYSGSLAVTIVEVVADGSGWKLARMTGAIDCGVAVSPNGLRAQMEGGMVFGLTSALTDSLSVVNGEVQQKNFDDLRSLRNNEVPPIDVVIIDSQEAPSGAGEGVVPTVAPALANAVAALTGIRQRSLPLTGWTGKVTETA
jgi:isoquinoline 1-oxidoreductase subunit beta